MAQTSEIFNDQLKYLKNCFVVAFQSLSCVQLFAPHGLQDTRLPCLSLSPRIFLYSYPLIQCCYVTNSSSVTLFSSCPQSFPASGSFPVRQLFASGGQSIGASASASAFLVNTQGWFPLGWTGLISLLSKWYSRVFSSTTNRKHQFLWFNSHIRTWLLEKP